MPIKDVVRRPDFRFLWGLHKDLIDVCKDCQFRYVCTDCRVLLDDVGNVFSKPRACGYDPYTDEWTEVVDDAVRQKRE